MKRKDFIILADGSTVNSYVAVDPKPRATSPFHCRGDFSNVVTGTHFTLEGSIKVRQYISKKGFPYWREVVR